MTKKVIALVPARGGSVGVPRKNLAVLDGKPLIEHVITVAKSSKYITATVVSSEDQEILDAATKLGATIRKRPLQFATHISTAADVVRDFLKEELSAKRANPDDLIVYLQPTSPLREAAFIDLAVEQAIQTGMPITSVSKAKTHPLKTLKMSQDGGLSNFVKNGNPVANRQELETAFVPDGLVYVFTVKKFLANDNFPVIGSLGILSPPETSIDIDSAFDLEVAEILLKKKKQQ